jgi:hypothetical protein
VVNVAICVALAGGVANFIASQLLVPLRAPKKTDPTARRMASSRLRSAARAGLKDCGNEQNQNRCASAQGILLSGFWISSISGSLDFRNWKASPKEQKIPDQELTMICMAPSPSAPTVT